MFRMRHVHSVHWVGFAVLIAIGMLVATSSFAAEATMFTVRIENISNGNALKLASGGHAPFALSPGLWMVHIKSAHVFESGKKTAARDSKPRLKMAIRRSWLSRWRTTTGCSHWGSSTPQSARVSRALLVPVMPTNLSCRHARLPLDHDVDVWPVERSVLRPERSRDPAV